MLNPALIAFHLPQFHPIPENDEWWGKGFTEWRNVTLAKPRFPGHQQPKLPGDLGFYDLRLPEIRAQQADLARAAGIGGFCYYHYWFGGRRVLERPVDDILASGRPDFPFCLCWANENWTRAWDGQDRQVLLAQNYSDDDDRAHARWLCRAFADPRYIRANGRPLFAIYRAARLPNPKRSTDIWRDEARRAGIGEIYLCRIESFPDERSDPAPLGFDAAIEFQPDWINPGRQLVTRRRYRPLVRLGLMHGYPEEVDVYDYPALVEAALAKPDVPYRRYRCVTPAWDNTARRKAGGKVFVNATPARYAGWLAGTLRRERQKAPPGDKFVFVNAWNEWAEGAYLEPDLANGHAYLDATRAALASAAG